MSSKTTSGLLSGLRSRMVAAALLALMMVVVAAVLMLAKDLPDQTGASLHYPAAGFNFAFGSGHPVADQLLVDEFANGYALLSSGPVSIQASQHSVLRYHWQPSKLQKEAAFFWRRSDDAQNVSRIELVAAGKQLIDLAKDPDWQGEITEFGFLLAGESGEAVEMGDASLMTDSLSTRLASTWQAWTTFEPWSQQSINLLHGGAYRPLIALPVLITTWLLLTIVLLWLFSRFAKNTGSRQLLITSGLVFLVAWLVLDVRWSANNFRQMQLSLQNQQQNGTQQRPGIEPDGEIYQYVQRLKSEVVGEQAARILIIGDQDAIEYYMLRAKYHLLPHSVSVAGRFAKELRPGSLDFVIFFGPAAGIAKVAGWNSSWQKALVAIDSGDLGVVYRVGGT